MILTGGEGRKEIELTPPASVPENGVNAVLPEPVCPQAVVTSLADEGFEEPAAPGASALDEGLERLQAGLPPEEGGSHE
jgi:hypothetical protein